MIYRAVRLLPVLVLAAASACTSLKDVQAFAKATKELADSSSQILTIRRENYVRLVESSVTLAAGQPDSIEAGFLGKQEAKAKALDNAMLRESAAVEVLERYASALETLASFDDSDAIESGSKSLADSLTSLAGKLGSKLPSSDVLAPTVTALAQLFIDVKKESELRKAISAASASVKTILELMRSDVEAAVSMHQAALVAAKVAKDAWLESAIVAYRAGGAQQGGADRAMLDAAAADLVGRHLDSLFDRDAEARVLDAYADAVKSCDAAHQAIERPKIAWKDLQTYISHVNALRSALGAWKLGK